MQDYQSTLKDKFNCASSTQTDILDAMSRHYHRQSELDEGVFNVTRKCARWLLHNCEFTLPSSETAAKSVFDFARILEEDGIKSMWSNSPIVINVDTNTIEDGVIRLHGLALSKAFGTYFPIKFVYNK